jgi:predicted TIM-barrel fold metal-dependent hydrolase
MILDGHIHALQGAVDPAGFAKRLKDAGVDGGIVASQPPSSFSALGEPRPAMARLDNLFAWCEADAELYPFFWIDPLENDAVRQVAAAFERGVVGFKVICDRFYPGDERAIRVFREIAQAARPILFHSGILWDGKASSVYNRPAGFEPLIEIPGLTYALAHISWPWCDECIAVYGKFLNSLGNRPDVSAEMFIDTTPGTPPIYRKDALTKVFTVGYDVENNVIFGTDSRTNAYDSQRVRGVIDRDRQIFEDIGLDASVVDKVFGGNLRRFVGASKEQIKKTTPEADKV